MRLNNYDYDKESEKLMSLQKQEIEKKIEMDLDSDYEHNNIYRMHIKHAEELEALEEYFMDPMTLMLTIQNKIEKLINSHIKNYSAKARNIDIKTAYEFRSKMISFMDTEINKAEKNYSN